MKFPEQYRVTDFAPLRSRPGDDFGLFFIPGPKGATLRAVASAGAEETDVLWEHVSVSLPNRCPNWPEMDYVKRLFWDDEEAVMQLHPPRSRWVNTHEYCLHLWRPKQAEIPLPPQILV